MSFFKKLFGKKPALPVPPGPESPSAAPQSDPAKDPNLIRVHDAYGREMFITKADWREKVLLGNLEKMRDRPDDLANTIIQSLHDGFAADVLPYAAHLATLDPNHERGHVLHAATLLDLKRYAEAETVLLNFIKNHGETGTALTNLAKTYSGRGDDSLTLSTLWRGLTLDPNQENGLGWYAVIHHEKDGPAAGLDAYRRVASLPGAWRSRLWLARDRLDQRDLPAALALYAEALACAPRPIPTDLLVQLSGDLGNHAHLPEIIQLAEPHFEIAVHGLAVGNNLIKAHLDLGQLDAARALLDRLYAQNRPDWKQNLSFWDTEIAKTRTEITATDIPAQPAIALITIDGPLWLRLSSPSATLAPVKSPDAVVVACLGSSFTYPAKASDTPRLKLADSPGRMSRALPLYLSEQLHLRTDAIGRVLQPWLQAGSGGFAVSGAAWSDEQACQQARGGEKPADYVAVLHIDGSSTPATATLRLLRTIDGRLLGTSAHTVTTDHCRAGFEALADDLLRLVREHAQVHPTPPPAFYDATDKQFFGAYQFRLEQALAVSIASTEGLTGGFLSGERDILDGQLQLCLDQPESVSIRLLFAHTLRGMKKVRPDILPEFRVRADLLQQEKPLSEPAQSVVARILAEAFAI